jgi:hypothetical protein
LVGGDGYTRRDEQRSPDGERRKVEADLGPGRYLATPLGADMAVAENPIIYSLAEITGAYISQARACGDEWTLVFRESIQYVWKWEPKSELKYMELVIQSAKGTKSKSVTARGSRGT